MHQPRYATVAKDLIEAIASGRYPVGGLLPTEIELCALYGVSRHTVRAAIEQLQGLGLVSRRKRVGTRVEASRPQVGYRQSVASLADLSHHLQAPMRDIRDVRQFVAAPEEAERLGLVPGERYFCIEAVHRASAGHALPLCVSAVYAQYDYAHAIELARAYPEQLIARLIEQHYERVIAVIDQQVQARSLTSGQGLELSAEAGSPALCVLQHYREENGDLMVVCESVYPADRYSLVSQLRRDRTPASAAPALPSA
nr:GntR family transcriptional regulator [uncultured Pseudomonas sp.]